MTGSNIICDKTIIVCSQPLRKELLFVSIFVIFLLSVFTNAKVIDAYTSDTIKVGSDPKDIAVNPVTNMVYVTNFDNVAVIDGATNNIVTHIPIGNNANGWAIEMNPDTNRAYVVANLANSVVVIDTSENTVITNIPVGNGPEGIAINTRTNMIYVANARESSNPNSISIIDGSSNKVVGSIDVRSISNNGLGADWPSAMTIDVERDLLYVGGTASSAIMVVNGANSEIVDYIERDGNFRRMTVDSVTGRVYAGNIDYGTVDVIRMQEGDNGNLHMLSDSIQKNNEPIIYPQAIAINPETNRLYVSDGDDSILVIDTETKGILSKIGVGRIPLGIAVNPVTNMIYVTNFDSDSVSVIDGAKDKVILTPSSFTYEIIGSVIITGIVGSIFIIKNRKRLGRKSTST